MPYFFIRWKMVIDKKLLIENASGVPQRVSK